ncbi:winged helix-turn-helix domain-containing protein [Granulicella sibirica]|nr:winged helix-turn-helix domain-containing protein [Granulicella sibirica]
MSLKRMDSARFHDFSIDRLGCVVLWQNEPVPLNRKTFDLLLYLIDHRDRLVTKEELLEKLWPDQFVEESNLTQHVFLLRKAFSAHGADQTIVQTVPRRGYRFTAPLIEGDAPAERMVLSATESITRITVEEEEDSVAASPIAGSPSAGSTVGEVTVLTKQPGVGQRVLEGAPRKSRHLAWALSGSLVMLVLLVAGWFGWQRWLDKTGGSPVDVVLTPTSGNTGDPVLDQALTTALRMDLAQSPFVSVVSGARVRATLTEMKQNPDAAMTPAIARDVCERTNSQAVLQGNVARVGQHFLLTEEATSCVNGATLADAKYEASNAEDLPREIDNLAESLRRKLGESRRSIARFDVPLFAGDTASIEALKDYSQATVQAGQGKYLDAIALLKKAVAADPNFAEGYYDLAANYRSTMDSVSEREAILKAYSLRDYASEPSRLATIALYHSAATQDLYEAERNYRNWTEVYPRSAQAWNGLSVVERDLGHNADAAIASQRALDLRPTILGLYVNLAHDQKETGDLKGALATCELAVAKGLDGDYIRQPYLRLAHDLHDAGLLQKQRDWETGHPDAVFVRAEEVEIALDEGRISDAHHLIAQVVDLMRRGGMGAADDFVRSEAINLIEAGDLAEGASLFRSVPIDPKDGLSVEGLARVGDFTQAKSILHAAQAEFPQGTLWNDERGPLLETFLAMATHRPKDAIAALERSRPIEGRSLFLPMSRADAYLADGDLDLAEREYRRIVEGPLHAAAVIEIPLSWLGLGRTLAAEGKAGPAMEAYQHFFSLWSHADANAKFLVEARNEVKALQGTRPPEQAALAP